MIQFGDVMATHTVVPAPISLIRVALLAALGGVGAGAFAVRVLCAAEFQWGRTAPSVGSALASDNWPRPMCRSTGNGVPALFIGDVRAGSFRGGEQP
jgi:hypothetical protein